jgi:hypothetical protein
MGINMLEIGRKARSMGKEKTFTKMGITIKEGFSLEYNMDMES